MKMQLRLAVESLKKNTPYMLATLTSLALVYGVNSYFTDQKSAVDLRIDLSIESSDLGQVFYSTGSGYLQKNSTRFELYEGRHLYPIRLHNASATPIKKFRIDPAYSVSGIVKVYSITVITPASEQLLDSTLLSQMVVPLHSLTLKPSGDFISLPVVGPDPSFEFTYALRVEPENRNLGSLILFLVVSTLGFNLLALVYMKKKDALEGVSSVTIEAGVIGTLVFLISLVISSIIPPFQSPDEFAHFQRAYFISQGETNLIVRDGVIGGEIDPAYLKYQAYYGGIARHSNKGITASRIGMSKYVEWSDERTFLQHFTTTPYMFAVYLPQAIAIKLGQSLNFSIDATYKLARLSILFFVVLCLVKAFTITQPGMMVLTLLFMPMTLFQFGSATVDGFSIALSVLILSIFSRSIRSEGSISRVEFAMMMIALVIVTTSRLYMLPLILLPIFMVAKGRDKSDIFILGLTVSIIVWWFGFGWVHSIDTSVQYEQTRAEILEFYLRQPLQFIEVLSNTLIRLGGFYVDGFIGILGWLDTRFSTAFYQTSTYFLGLAFVLSFSFKQIRENALGSATLILVSVASCFLVFVALLISAPGHPAIVISGVQGRYFMIPALVSSYAISSSIRSENAIKSFTSTSLLLLWVAFVCSFAIPVLIGRYYLTAGN
ncbi:MAG TPA: DUF2142 domain-containing protein [Gammaproteobacteria bacterium]|nr:DUF2142 domain-containing protein [Gammaproteobacteria bacterium]